MKIVYAAEHHLVHFSKTIMENNKFKCFARGIEPGPIRAGPRPH